MILKKVFPYVLSVFLLLAMVSVTSQSDKEVKETQKQIISTQDTPIITEEKQKESTKNEMRGVWISYMELDMQNEEEKDEQAFRNKFEKMTVKCKEYGFNTLIVQVRPFADALYESEYYPYSHLLTGTQGKNPEYDPLKIMCEISRNHGMSIHAWVNPYRIKSESIPYELSKDNPYVQNSDIGIEYDEGIYLDPSDEKARELIINGVIEIAEKYDVDGIQFDDYFYPTTDEEFDSEQYTEYVSNVGENNKMSLNNWRVANVNILICDTYRAIHSLEKDVVFGISPQGNIDNNANLYADVVSWCTCKGFVDYICPQIYFSLENPALSFDDCLDSWCSLEYNDNVSLYVGLSGYKAGSEDYDDGTWINADDILAQEYEIIKNNEKVSGFMLYSYESLENKTAYREIENLKNALN